MKKLNEKYFQMSIWSRFVETFRNCFPAWLSRSYDELPTADGSTASRVTKKEQDGKRKLTKDERLEVLKKALAKEYYCSGHPPFEVTGHKLMECGCPDGTHGPLVVTETGNLYYPA